jgi:hypothetical protein
MAPFLKTFIQNGVAIRYDVIKAIIPELKKVADWFSTQTSFKFYGSSILFIYDGASTEPTVRVKMVDFAHVVDTTDGTIDTSYLQGCETLLRIFSNLVQEGEDAAQIDKKHEFQKYVIGSNLCSMCSKYIWMTKGAGVRCVVCGISSHAECQAFLPDNCKIKELKQSDPLHNLPRICTDRILDSMKLLSPKGVHTSQSESTDSQESTNSPRNSNSHRKSQGGKKHHNSLQSSEQRPGRKSIEKETSSERISDDRDREKRMAWDDTDFPAQK